MVVRGEMIRAVRGIRSRRGGLMIWAVRGCVRDRRRRVIMVVEIGIVSRIISTVVIVRRVVIVVIIIIWIIISPIIIIIICLIQGVSRMLVEEVHHCLE